MPTPPSLARRAAAAGVGAFALWQVVFLPAANLMNFVPRRPGPGDLDPPRHLFQEYGTFTDVEPLQRAADAVGGVLDFWAEASGQEQGWKMFVPGPPSHSQFQAVEFRFPDGTADEVRSAFEPADLRSPAFRPPLVNDRVFNFEIQVAHPGYYCTPDALDRYPDSWAEELPKTVRSNQSVILAWLKWRLAQYRAANPGRGEPAEVVLKFRYVPTPLPDGPREWTGPVVERAYARWVPGGPPDPAFLPVEAIDPASGRSVRFPAGGDR